LFPVLVIFIASACDGGLPGAVELPPIDPSTFAPEVRQQIEAVNNAVPYVAAETPVVAAAVASGTVERTTENYQRVGQFLSWQPDDMPRGRVETSDPDICSRNRNECHRGNIDANRAKLVDHVVTHAGKGGSTVTCDGSVDARSSGIGADRQVELAGNRGKDCANLVKREIRKEADKRGVSIRVLTTTEAERAGVECTAVGVTCVDGQASKHVIDACQGKTATQCNKGLKQRKEPCVQNDFDSCTRGRGASAKAVFSTVTPPPVCPDGTKLAGQPIPPDGNCDPKTPCPDGTKLAGQPIPADGNCNPERVCPPGTKLAGQPIPADGNCNPVVVVITCVPDPSIGVFCSPDTNSPGNPGNGGSGNPGNGGSGNPGNGGSGNPGNGSSSDPGNGSTGTDSYCEIYPEDCLSLREILDTVTVRIELSAPNPFVVGGTLREHDVRVASLAVYCGNAPCSATAGVSLNTFEGRLDLVSSSTAKYTRCATPSSRNCAYYLSGDSSLQVVYNGRGLTGNLLRAGFVSATPSGVTVRPTLVVEEVTVTMLEYEWVGGEGCNVDRPARSCWEEYLGDAIDMTGRTNVVVIGSGSTIRSGDSFYVNRRVVGTIGS